jgi:flagellar biosynthesis protein FliQ
VQIMKLTDRLAAGCGAATIVLLTVGGDVLGTPPGPQVAHPTGQQDLDHLNWVADTPSAQVGVGLELLGFVLMIVFISYLSTRVRDAGWLATAALAGGLIEVAIKLGSGAPLFAAYMLRDEISPETARVLIDMNGAAFVISWLPLGLFTACVAGACLRVGVLGRVLGWSGVVVGVATVVMTAATGIHVLSAIFVPMLLCTLWVLIVSLRLATQRSASTARIPDRVSVTA